MVDTFSQPYDPLKKKEYATIEEKHQQLYVSLIRNLTRNQPTRLKKGHFGAESSFCRTNQHQR